MTRRGLQAEVLVSLAVVMVTAMGVLCAVLLRTQESRLGQLRQLAARALAADARAPLLRMRLPGLEWWIEPSGASLRPWTDGAGPAGESGRAIADEARSLGKPVLKVGRPWEPLWFAAPLERERAVAVARLPPASAGSLLLALLAADVAVFTAFGAYLLRRRLVLPLQRLAAAARGVAEGGLDARVPEDGVAETAELARAFNHMTEALAARTDALEKAVADLRSSNRHLQEARAGLARADRLAAVGRLAAGVAHEVGNPLGAILAFLDLVGRDPELSSRSRGYVDRAGREGGRVREILGQLLDFSRPPRSVRQAVDVASVCEEVAGLVRAQRRYAGVCLEIETEGSPPFARADPGRVAQIVLNLLLNAADATRDVPGAQVRVRIRPAHARLRRGDGADAASRRGAADAVECVVCDNGPGIAPEDRERVFDPFFTTKPPGEGTGLGLANAVRLAEEFGGELELGPAPGVGASFVLRIPADPSGGAAAVREPETTARPG